MAKLLVLPNDAIGAHRNRGETDFLNEFNPQSIDGKRFFSEVGMLNFKQDESETFAGVESIPVIGDKTKFYEILEKLQRGEIEFSYPLFEEVLNPYIDRMIRTTKIYSPSIIRTSMVPFAVESGIQIKDATGIPLLISINDMSRTTKAVESVDHIVCISDALKEKVTKTYGVAEKKVVVIPDGIDFNRFYQRTSEEVYSIVDPKYNTKFKSLSVGRQVRSKNIETLLESIAIANKKLNNNLTHIHLGPKTKYDAETAENLLKLRKDLGLENNFHFAGSIPQEQLPFYYSWADVYALPTLWEGLGRAQIEALACGTPVITTNEAPMNTIVSDGFNGYTINPKDLEQLASRLIKLISDPSLLNQMGGERAIKSVSQYNIDTVMQMHYDNYKKILSKNKAL